MKQQQTTTNKEQTATQVANPDKTTKVSTPQTKNKAEAVSYSATQLLSCYTRTNKTDIAHQKTW